MVRFCFPIKLQIIPVPIIYDTHTHTHTNTHKRTAAEDARSLTQLPLPPEQHQQLSNSTTVRLKYTHKHILESDIYCNIEAAVNGGGEPRDQAPRFKEDRLGARALQPPRRHCY